MPFNLGSDRAPRYAFAVVSALLALILCAVVGTVIYQYTLMTPEPAALNDTLATQEGATDLAEVHVENGVVRFYFATDKADIAIGGNVALADVVRGVTYGKRARISGFHDASGDRVANQALAKQRALAVYATLLSLGVPESRIELQKPQDTQASGSPDEARRVEVMLID